MSSVMYVCVRSGNCMDLQVPYTSTFASEGFKEIFVLQYKSHYEINDDG
jgi:hypothetical protein